MLSFSGGRMGVILEFGHPRHESDFTAARAELYICDCLTGVLSVAII